SRQDKGHKDKPQTPCKAFLQGVFSFRTKNCPILGRFKQKALAFFQKMLYTLYKNILLFRKEQKEHYEKALSSQRRRPSAQKGF
ncbi:MAG: hypothetical protein IJY89_06785, partial [Clostridia bacterium]|nr:hypothetical protein [Clostridia bacterium]